MKALEELRAALEAKRDDARRREDEAAARRLPETDGRSVEERLWAVRSDAFDEALDELDGVLSSE